MVQHWHAAGLGALTSTVLGATGAGISPLKEVTITAIIPTIVLPQAKAQGGNTAPHQEIIGLKIY